MKEKAKILVRFHGTRGSLPSPLNAADVRIKILTALLATKDDENFKEALQSGGEMAVENWALDKLGFSTFGTYGGNTTCISLICGDTMIIFDMGSGIRELGKTIMSEIIERKIRRICIFLSHVHWDHIQGYPFFGMNYVPRMFFPKNVSVMLYGSTGWSRCLFDVLKGQMERPMFPIEFEKIILEGPDADRNTVYDRFCINDIVDETTGEKIVITARRLNHPDETYGYRVEYAGKVFVFASDTEPFRGEHLVLTELAKNADFLCLDCQYSKDTYMGTEPKGFSRQGWGHGFDEAVAEAAIAANAKNLYLIHHDPASTDEKVAEIEAKVKSIFPNTKAAYDGMVVEI